MADLAQALDRALRERYPVPEIRTPITQQRGLHARMNQLEKAHAQKGDRRGAAARRAAEAAGIRPATWRAWKRGANKPGPALLKKLQSAYDKRVKLPKLRRKVNAAGAPNRVTVTAQVNWNGYKNRTAQRSTTLGGMHAAMVATIRAWARDGPAAAAAAFEAGAAAAHQVPTITFEGDDVEVEFP